MSSGMQSFYGGPNGQSFQIKQIFNNRVELDADINKGWASSITVGEYVLISYGYPNAASYATNRDIDLNAYSSTYNSTLWQKGFANNSDTGLSYNLIASMTGFTPRIDASSVVITPNVNPSIGYDTSSIDNPKITFRLPRAATFETVEELRQDVDRIEFGTVLDAGESPVAYFKETDDGDYELWVDLPQGQKVEELVYTVLNADREPWINWDDEEDVNRPTIYMGLPQSQVLQKGTTTALDADEDPDFEIDSSNINRPILNFSIPRSQVLQEGSTTVVNADQDPSFNINSTNINEPVLNFNLPQSQVMDDPELEVTGPTIRPTVTLNSSNINRPKLEFTLPRATEFIYGDLMGEDRNYTGVICDLLVGDYYVNKATGFIYLATNRTAVGGVDFTYIACLQAPKPTVSAEGINPYTLDEETGEYIAAEPTVERTVTTTGWTLDLGLPRVPNTITTPFTFVGVEEDGSVTFSKEGVDAAAFNFTLPRGSRFFVGTVVNDNNLTPNPAIDGAKKGDYYINNSGAGATNAGEIYKFDGMTWVKQEGYGLQGPVGEAINVIAKEYITPTEVATDDLASVGAYLTAKGYNPAPNEIISVTYHDTTTNDDKAYWYYKPGAYSDNTRTWWRDTLTGGIGSFVERDYSTDSEKVYNTTYINTLLVENPSDKDKQGYNATKIDSLLSTMQSTINTLTARVTALEAALSQDITEQLSWGPIGTIGYTLLEAEPDDWTTNWVDYYELNANGIPQHLTDASAPTFATNTYYEKD